MRQIKIIIISVVFLVLNSCKKENFQKTYLNKDGFNILKVLEENESSEIRFTEFIENIKYIPLETKTQSIIGEISKMSIDNQYIYILDRKFSKKLFVFNKKGKFLKIVGGIGDGPGEYNTLTDFSVLDNNKLMLYDYSNARILFYENLEFSHSEKISSYNKSIVRKDSLYYYNPEKGKYSNLKNEFANHDLLIANTNNVVLNKYFPYDINSDVLYTVRYPFRDFKDSLTFIDPMSSKIYRIKGRNVFPKYFLDFGKHQFPYEKTISNVDFKENYNKYGHILNNFFENEKYLFFTAVYNSSSVTFCLMNKQSKLLKLSKKMINDLDNLNDIKFVNSNDNSIYGYVNADYIVNNVRFDKKEHNLTSVKSLDNPIVSICCLKK